MSRKPVSVLTLLVLVGMFSIAFRVQKIDSSPGPIYIKDDGSISPSGAPISTVDNATYTITDDINDPIVVERTNIVVDGAGHTLQGSGRIGRGMDLSYVRNITIKNMEIKEFEYGIYLSLSHNINISWNNITRSNYYGIYLDRSSNNTLTKNNITAQYSACIYLYSSLNNSISENSIITGEGHGIYLDRSSNNTLSENNVNGNALSRGDGIYLRNSSKNTLSGNNMEKNIRGIYLEESSDNIIVGNDITNHLYSEGISLYYSINTTLAGNIMNNNKYNFGVKGNSWNDFIQSIDTSNLVNGKPVYYLINQTNAMINPETYPEVGYLALVNCVNMTVERLNLGNNINGLALVNCINVTVERLNLEYNVIGLLLLYTNNSKIVANNIRQTSYDTAILLISSSKNHIYHNNLFEYIAAGQANSFDNVWDNGLEGNYWGPYGPPDVGKYWHADWNPRDGINDNEYNLDSNNTDRYPMWGTFNSFNTSLGYPVNVITNSFIEDFEYFPSNSTIMIHVFMMNPTDFVRICIPHVLIAEHYNVTIDGMNPQYTNYTLYDNGTHTWIYFSYQYIDTQTREIIIAPEFSSFFILPLFMMATLLAVIVYKRKYSQ